MRRLFKNLIGLLLLPVCAGTSMALFDLLKSLRPVGQTQLFFIGGMLTYALLYLVSFKMTFLYVLGHEAVHALFAVLSGGAVKSFSVSTKGGNVTTTKTNTIVSLGPYFFPIYTVFFALIFFVLGVFFQETYRYTNVFLYLSGFSIAFHFFMTFNSLKTEQQDLIENGHLFSLVLVYIINILVLALLLSLVFSNASMFVFLKRALNCSAQIVQYLWQKVSTIAGI